MAIDINFTLSLFSSHVKHGYVSKMPGCSDLRIGQAELHYPIHQVICSLGQRIQYNCFEDFPLVIHLWLATICVFTWHNLLPNMFGQNMQVVATNEALLFL